ncbi:hypothetical protein C8Q74DRAFT_1369592 [Fomes fomentarius]|nr:hypothetical protein C8Q74DRAFT_1369592 [Fomes fomentarius]
MAHLQHPFGAILLGTFFALPIYGLSAFQAYRYFRSYPTDKRSLKVLVCVILLMDTLHSVEAAHICYYYLSLNYFNPSAFDVEVWSVQLLPVTTGLIGFIAQFFYARRIYTVTPRYWLVVFAVGFLMFIELVMCIVDSAVEFMNPHGDMTSSPSATWFQPLLIGVATLVDLLLTGTLVIILRKSRMRTVPGRHGTESVLDTLAVYAVLATALNISFAIPMLVSSIVSRDTSELFTAISIPGTKVYATSVLVFLNCRRVLSERANRYTGTTLAFNLSIFDHQNRNVTSSGDPEQGGIHTALPHPARDRDMDRGGWPSSSTMLEDREETHAM